MKGLPFTMTRGPLLAQVMHEARQDPGRNALCGSCGARMPIQPDLTEQTVRCPSCMRLERVTVTEEVPWRLTAASAEALRRTGRWLRRL